MMTFIPSDAKDMAIARPILFDAPVTMAVGPLNEVESMIVSASEITG